MNALSHTSFEDTLVHTDLAERIVADDLPLADRWSQAKGTWSEKQTLLEIAAEELRENGQTWLFAAAMDAATRPDERDEHVARLEEEIEALEERAHAAAHLAAMPADRLALLNAAYPS